MRCWSPVGMPTSAWPVGFSSRITVLSKSNRMRAERVIDSSRPFSPCWRAKVWPTSDTSTRLRTSSDRRWRTGSSAGGAYAGGVGMSSAPARSMPRCGGRFLDLARGGGADRVDVVLLEAAQAGGVGDRLVVRFVGRHQVRQAHDADQRVGRFQARARLVVVQHRIGQEGIEVPAFDQPGARFGVGDLQGALLDRAQVFVVARGEIEGVFLRRGGQQREPADVVQQAGQVGFLDVRVVHALGQVARDDGGGERILPEAAQVGAAGMGEVVEGLEHRFADHQRLDHVGAERHQRLLEADRAGGAVVGRAVGDGRGSCWSCRRRWRSARPARACQGRRPASARST